MMIPITSTHRKNAMALMDYYYEPEVAAEVAAYVNYVCPVEGAQAEMEKIDPELAKSPFIFPSEYYIKDNNVQGFRALSPAGGRRLQRHLGKGGGQLMALFSSGGSGFREATGDLHLESVTKQFASVHRGRRPQPHRPAWVVLRPARPLGLRQDDDPADGGRPRAAHPRTHAHRRHRPHRLASLRAPGQHGVPELRALPAPDHPRQRRLRARSAVVTPTPPRRGRRRARAGADVGLRRRASRPSSPVASSSAWRWPGPWSTVPRCCCSTSRSAPSTSSCVARCRSSSSGSRPRSGLTFIHVTHDQEEAMTMADTVAVMNAGQIEQMGHPEELYDLPRTSFVANFVGQSNLGVGEITGTDGDNLVVEVAGTTVRIPQGPVRGPRAARSCSGCGRRRSASAASQPDRRRQRRQGHRRRRLVHRRRDPVPRHGPQRQHLGRLRAEPRRRAQHPAPRRPGVARVGLRARVRGRGGRGSGSRSQGRVVSALAHVGGGTPAAPDNGPPQERGGRSWAAYLLLIPGGLWLLVFFVLPLAQLFTVSLQSGFPGYPGYYYRDVNFGNYLNGHHRLRAALRAVPAVCRPGHLLRVRPGLPARLRDGVQGRASGAAS